MTLEHALLSATPDDMPASAAIMAALPEAPPVGLQSENYDDLGIDPATGPELMTADEFAEQFVFLHYIGQSFIEAKTGEDTAPLGKQAETQGGRKAAEAAYKILLRNDFIAGLFLKKGEGIVTDLLAVGMHAFACRQIVMAALNKAPVNAV